MKAVTKKLQQEEQLLLPTAVARTDNFAVRFCLLFVRVGSLVNNKVIERRIYAAIQYRFIYRNYCEYACGSTSYVVSYCLKNHAESLNR